MKISIVVPAFNEERGLAETLRSIRASAASFDAHGWRWELIVCDNNSTDATAAIARAEGADVVFEPHNQISRARNAGAAAATGDWLVFVDADSHPTPGLFADMAEAVRQGRCLAGGSLVRVNVGDLLPGIVVAGWNRISRLTRWAAGSFIFCDAEAFREVGGFTLELYAGEEIDLFRRLKRLARRQGRTVVILTRHPLLTSARKAQLYTAREGLGFAVRTVLRGGRTLRSPRECFHLYDGRR
jgi:glycosyltransferase involved in cell wall biosynthesis